MQAEALRQWTRNPTPILSSIQTLASLGRAASELGKTRREIGKLRWGLAFFVLCLVTAVLASAQTLTTLVSFNGSDGGNPYRMSLVQGRDGNLYGTTQFGGDHTGCSTVFSGCGTIFKVTTGGTLTSLYSFCAKTNCTDGAQPVAGLVLGTDGNFYGTTEYAGANCLAYYDYCGGTIFKITPSGTFTTLYSFCSQAGCADGSQPTAGLVQATDGNFYGTTYAGGVQANYCAQGTVFKVTPTGAFTTLYNFGQQPGCSDGSRPLGALIQGTDGNLYGTTVSGGNSYHYGTVFKITTAGTLTTLKVLQFPQQPFAGLVQGADGKFYATTHYGGGGGYCGQPSHVGCGTVFKITSTGTLTVLHKFCTQANCPDGAFLVAPLVQGTDGNFYGTTDFNGGAVFNITSSGTLTTLHTFSSNSQDPGGSAPDDGLVQATDGNFYGTTEYGGTSNNCGGTYNCGTIFRLSMGLSPFVEPVPSSGKVGATVRILGTNLKGATSVSFNGTAATFTVVSGTQIKTTVPTGATTGTVTVITPSSTLSSNVAFQVLP